jgi:electron transfer flavoprotein beta subunit
MGPAQAKETLHRALAMGADQALLLSDRSFAGSDTWATAYALSQAIEQLGDVDIILCGKQAIDGDTGQTGPGIAMQLGIRQLTYVSRIQNIDADSNTITVERLLEEGREIVNSALPVLVTVVKDINHPRYPSVKGILRSYKSEISIVTADALEGIDRNYLGLNGSPTRVVKVFNPPARNGEITWIKGNSPKEVATDLAEAILKEQVI